jgi:hypothetical protein
VEACQTQALDPLSSLSKHTRLSDFIYTIVS